MPFSHLHLFSLVWCRVTLTRVKETVADLLRVNATPPTNYHRLFYGVSQVGVKDVLCKIVLAFIPMSHITCLGFWTQFQATVTRIHRSIHENHIISYLQVYFPSRIFFNWFVFLSLCYLSYTCSVLICPSPRNTKRVWTYLGLRCIALCYLPRSACNDWSIYLSEIDVNN